MTSFILEVFELTVGMSAFIALLLLTLKLFGKKFTAKCRYILWTLVIIRLAIPFSFGLMPSLIEIPIEPDLLQITVEAKLEDGTVIPSSGANAGYDEELDAEVWKIMWSAPVDPSTVISLVFSDGIIEYLIDLQ